MQGAKLTSEQRERLREQRSERQLVRAKAKQRNFEYVIKQPPIPKIAFGSSMERDTLPVSGPALSSFMRAIQGEILEYPGPFEHSYWRGLEIDYASQWGTASFVSKSLRLPLIKRAEGPSIGAYDVERPYSKKQMARPFNIGLSRKSREPYPTPGCPTYPYHLPLPRVKISMAFGKQRRPIHYTTIFCSQFNPSKCKKCGETPIGDYWHNFKLRRDLCRPCMKLLRAELKDCKLDTAKRTKVLRELGRFQPVRYCLFYHDHQGTTAAVSCMSKDMLRKRLRLEDYFSQYFQTKDILN